MSKLMVRPMRIADLDEVIAIEQSAYEFPWTRGNFTDSMSAGYTAMSLTFERSVVGYFILMKILDECHLLNIAISRHEQGKGWGTFLLDWCCAHVQGLGCEGLLLEVRLSNDSARHIYEKSGFRLVGVRKHYYPAAVGREDALVLFKSFESPNQAFDEENSL
ncbi:MAG: ribosomal protein S18-alanine N-acetyltransferase [Burkholderiales bacterium]|nr:ribosomal protein S18-alanine N-acetyltransferase [Burkholderiales bacterium]